MPTDYTPLIRKLIRTAKAQGYHVNRLRSDGGTLRFGPDALERGLIYEATIGDSARIGFRHEYRADFSVLLVYGHPLQETIADYTDTPEADAICREVMTHFEGR